MFNFSKKDLEFFDLFLENAKYFHLGAVLLDEVIKDPNKTFERIEEILGLESAADEVNERIIEKLNLSFITPIDREDIYSIAGELATGVDMLHDALQRIIMYHAGHATEKSARMTKLLLDSTNAILRAFELMKDIKKNQFTKFLTMRTRATEFLEKILACCSMRQKLRRRNTAQAKLSYT